jgi:hypothetical protein
LKAIGKTGSKQRIGVNKIATRIPYHARFHHDYVLVLWYWLDFDCYELPTKFVLPFLHTVGESGSFVIGRPHAQYCAGGYHTGTHAVCHEGMASRSQNDFCGSLRMWDPFRSTFIFNVYVIRTIPWIEQLSHNNFPMQERDII